MSHQQTFDPHDSPRSTLASPSDRVDDDYVFVAVATDSSRDDHPVVNYSIRVDPSDGRPGELRLRVTRKRRTEGSAEPPRTESATVTIPAPGVGSRPRARELGSIVETWYHQHLDPRSTDRSAPDSADVSPSHDRPD
jgi:hypothetical protein